LHCHSLRHYFGERLVDTGTDMEMVRRLMGHSKLDTTQRYIGRTDQQRREAIDLWKNLSQTTIMILKRSLKKSLSEK